ncbi:MAG: hypothetical protein AAB308_02005 [Nitrospirota bacterium]
MAKQRALSSIQQERMPMPIAKLAICPFRNSRSRIPEELQRHHAAGIRRDARLARTGSD